MSFPYVRAVFEMAPRWTTPAEFAVLVTLANFADRDGVAYPSKPTIARRVGLKPRQVWNVTRALEARGLITIDAGAGPRGCDLFTLTFEQREQNHTTLATHCQSQEPATLATNCQSHETAPNGDPSNQSTSTPAITADDPSNGLHQPRQPIATNPKDPEEIQEREPVGVSSHSQKLENEERERQTYRTVLAIAEERVENVSSHAELLSILRTEMADVSVDVTDRAALIAWNRRQISNPRQRAEART